MEKKGEKKLARRTDEQRTNERKNERTNEHHKKIGRKSRGEFYRRERSPAKRALLVSSKVAKSYAKYDQSDVWHLRWAEMMLHYQNATILAPQ